jgi:hypothetical protein
MVVERRWRPPPTPSASGRVAHELISVTPLTFFTGER